MQAMYSRPEMSDATVFGRAGAAAQSPEAESYYRDNIHSTVTQVY